MKANIYANAYIEEFGGYSDANDASVLIAGQNMDGSSASAGDYVLAGVGILLPVVSGSSVKSVIKELVLTEPGMQSSKKIKDMAKDFKGAKNQKEFNKLFLASDGPAKLIENPIDGKTYIFDGHHRLKAAEEANTGFSAPVKYIKLEEQNRFDSYQEIIDAAETKL